MRDGVELWSVDKATSIDDGICVDTDLLYASDGATTFTIDKVTGYLSQLDQGIDNICCSDGISIYGYSTNNIERNWIGVPSLEYQRCVATDGNRVPWSGMLAIPTGRNL